MDQFPKMKQLLIKTLQDLQLEQIKDLQLEQISSWEWDLSGVSIRLEEGRYVVFYLQPCDDNGEEELEGGESPSLELAIHLAVMIHFYQAR